MLKKGRALLSATFELLQPTNQGKIVRFIRRNHDQTVTDPNLYMSIRDLVAVRLAMASSPEVPQAVKGS